MSESIEEQIKDCEGSIESIKESMKTSYAHDYQKLELDLRLEEFELARLKLRLEKEIGERVMKATRF